MFKNRITFIEGERSSGKTQFLIKTLESLLQLGELVHFIDVIKESEYLKYLHPNLNYLDVNGNSLLGLEKNSWVLIDDSDCLQQSDLQKLLQLEQNLIVTTNSEWVKIFKRKRRGKFLSNLLTTKKNKKDAVIRVFSRYYDGPLRQELLFEIEDQCFDFTQIKPLIFSEFREKKLNLILAGRDKN
jgi:archaellum biogenesis ATPase FlaH